ncbi:MAG: hypothetical protein ABIO45_01160 [Burkholderiaceae bacterium]
MPAPIPTIDDDASAPYISFQDFRDGWRHGRFRIVVDPKLAPGFVAHRLHATSIALALIGPGIALALSGYPVLGAVLVALGIAVRRAIKWQASKLLVQMAAQQAEVYHDATARGVMEVQRVTGEVDARP